MAFDVGNYIRYVCGGPGPEYSYGVILKDCGDKYIIYDGLHGWATTVSKDQRLLPIELIGENELNRGIHTLDVNSGTMKKSNLKTECEQILSRSEEIIITIEAGGRWPIKSI